MHARAPRARVKISTRTFGQPMVTRGIFVNFHLYFDFWRVYLTDLDSYHWGKMRQLSLNQVIYICSVLCCSFHLLLCFALLSIDILYKLSWITTSTICVILKSSIADLIPLSPAWES